jgi:hypothetical protein
MRPKLAPYLERLRALPFVRSIEVVKENVKVGGVHVDALLAIKTPTGKKRVFCEVKSSNMSHELAFQAVALLRDVRPLIVAAPVIGSGVGQLLADNGASFVDLRGNCDLDLGGRYIARIQGRSGEKTNGARALRTPSYSVLFAVLADPSLISVPVRTLGAAAGVSRQPAVTLRERLLDLGLVLRSARGFVWAPQGQKRALDLWLAGYATSVRPGLLIGAFTTQDPDPGALELRIGPILDKTCTWRWGGGAACDRLTGYFRGEQTVVHVADEPADLPRELRAVPARDGRLVLLRTPGPKGLVGATSETAHPLLVYTELLTNGSERAREAARDLAERFSFGREA